MTSRIVAQKMSPCLGGAQTVLLAGSFGLFVSLTHPLPPTSIGRSKRCFGVNYKLNWGCARDEKPRAVLSRLFTSSGRLVPFEKTTSETHSCGSTKTQRKITTEQTSSGILHVTCYT